MNSLKPISSAQSKSSFAFVTEQTVEISIFFDVSILPVSGLRSVEVSSMPKRVKTNEVLRIQSFLRGGRSHFNPFRVFLPRVYCAPPTAFCPVVRFYGLYMMNTCSCCARYYRESPVVVEVIN